MKSYVCVTFLLMYGLAQFATQVRGTCQLNGQVFNLGLHTFRPCSLLECFEDGTITIEECPPFMTCPPGSLVYKFMPRDETRKFPNCCPRPVCVSNNTVSTLYDKK
ncbi:uncharacterized protein LOC105199527 [Solenopsis invicta]|uniref:uncharacterized protein LOC105199527 n=1 Tax=Solenopsis invicta TaxID=13686 RepID=UPI0001FEA50E|nr:uncharacterized protein LOC105199527 [Solenopsis invicta]